MTTEPCELALTRETGGDKDDGGGGGRSPICLPSRTLAEAVTTTDIWSASSAASLLLVSRRDRPTVPV